MNRYTIYCTEEQTKKALELGAPIYVTNEHLYAHPHECKYWTKVDIKGNFCSAKIPTAEEMIGWLEEQGICIEPYRTACGYLCTMSKVPTGSQIYSQQFEGDDKDSGQFTTRGKATLAAIDWALEYLTSNKE